MRRTFNRNRHKDYCQNCNVVKVRESSEQQLHVVQDETEDLVGDEERARRVGPENEEVVVRVHWVVVGLK